MDHGVGAGAVVVEEAERIADEAGTGENAVRDRSLPENVEFPTLDGHVAVIMHSKDIGACKAGSRGVCLREQHSRPVNERIQANNKSASQSARRVIRIKQIEIWVSHIDALGADASQLSGGDD